MKHKMCSTQQMCVCIRQFKMHNNECPSIRLGAMVAQGLGNRGEGYTAGPGSSQGGKLPFRIQGLGCGGCSDLKQCPPTPTSNCWESQSGQPRTHFPEKLTVKKEAWLWQIPFTWVLPWAERAEEGREIIITILAAFHWATTACQALY